MPESTSLLFGLADLAGAVWTTIALRTSPGWAMVSA